MFTKARSFISTVAITAMVLGTTTPLYARDRDNNPPGPRGGPGTNWENPPGHRGGPGASPDRHWYGPVHRGHAYVVPPNRYRVYRNVYVVRPYGHWYYGYGPYHDDSAAYAFLAFTAITMVMLNQLNEQQQRALESAQVRATTAPIGETINWTDGGAKGSVVATREGTSSTGRYCREFQQTVTIGGKSEQAYGTACQQPDGSWEVVSTGDGQE